MRSAHTTSPECRVVDDLDMAAALDELGLEIGALDDALAHAERTGTGLDPLWQIPPDLEDRIAQGVQRRLRNRQTAWLVADLMGLAWNTARAVIEPDDGGPRD